MASPAPPTTKATAVANAGSTGTSGTSSPVIPSLRRRRLFFSHLFQYITVAYQYLCAMFNLTIRRRCIEQQQQQQSSPTKRTATAAAAVATDRKATPATVSAALQYYKGKTLILDLDETLVHSVRLGSYAATRQQKVSASIKRKKIEVRDDKQSLLYEVYKRPHVDFFLKTVIMHRGGDHCIGRRAYFVICHLDKSMVQSRHLYSIYGRICRSGD